MENKSLGKALVTGASSGIGAVYADRLAKRGYDLILVSRNTTRLSELRQSIMKETGKNVEIVGADLTKKEEIKKIENILKKDDDINMFVNNAGVGSVKNILQADVEEMDDMIQLNINALTRLSYAIAPIFAEKKSGTIINISSVVGIAVEVLNGVYSSSKSYVLSFGHSLQKDLAESGVRVQTVLPAATATEFWDIAGYPQLKEDENTMSAEDLVDAAMSGLDIGEIVTIPALQENHYWEDWEKERKEFSPLFKNKKPAPRYKIK